MTDLEIKPIPKTSMVDAAFDVLRSRILRGILAPGDRLPAEQELARLLGVSRSTIREALNRLASANLIRIQHGGSKIVLDYLEHAGLEVVPVLIEGSASEVDPSLVRSVTELRNVVTPDAARLAAERASPEEVKKIRAYADAMLVENQSLNELTEGSLKFWKSIVLASGNLAYRLGFNSMVRSFVEDTDAFRPVIEEELRAGELYVGIAKSIQVGNAKQAAKKSHHLVSIGSDAIFKIIDQIQRAVVKAD